MKLEGEHLFKGPREAVWEMLRDPDALSGAIPGAQSLTKISDQEFEGAINLRMGPVSGSFAGKVTLSNEVAPSSFTLTAEGRGAPGFAKGVGDAELIDQGDGTTLMKYSGEMQIGGMLASVGQRMVDSVAKSMFRQGFEAMDRTLEARLAGKSAEEIKSVKAPTEADYVAGVAKDMVKDVTSNKTVKLLVYIIPIIVLIVIAALLLSRL